MMTSIFSGGRRPCKLYSYTVTSRQSFADKDVLYQCVGMHYNYRTSEFLNTPEDALKFLWKQTSWGTVWTTYLDFLVLEIHSATGEE